jgi:hypothetical protein
MSQLLRMLGVVLVLGGLAHSTGVAHLYLTSGVPDFNRVLLDTWVAEAHIVGGALYFVAFRAMRAGSAWRAWAVGGALTILAYAVPFIPVLFIRAPPMFRIPTTVYALLSLFIALRAARPMNADGGPHTGTRAGARV